MFDTLKKLVYEEEKTPAKAEAPAAAAAPAKIAYTPPTTSTGFPTGTGITSIAPGASEELYKRILGATDPAGYKEFNALTTQAEALEKVMPGDVQRPLRLKSALAFLASQGLTAENILSCFNNCIEALEREKSKFAQTIDNKTAERVTARENKVRSLGEQVGELQAQILSMQQEQMTLTTEAQEERRKIQQAEMNFSNAYARRHQELEYQRTEYTNILTK
jgi:hypothetical protein